MLATWRCGGRRIRTCRWCWRVRRLRSRAGSGRAAGEFRLVEMPRRVFNRPLPAVRTIDLREESHNRGGRGAISRPLHQAMEAALRDGGQVILLLNRRGLLDAHPMSGMWLRGQVPPLRLAAHVPPPRQARPSATTATTKRPAPTTCPDCKSPGLRFSGLGTQKLEAEVRAQVPRLTPACEWIPTACSSAAATNKRWLRSATAKCEFCWARR